MLRLGITSDHKAPCLGLGYGFFPDTGLALLRADASYRVVTAVPSVGQIKNLVLSSVACLSADERDRLRRFMVAGGWSASPVGVRRYLVLECALA